MAPVAIPALTKKPFPLESHRVWLDSDRPVVRPVDICLERMEVKMKKATTKRLLATLLSFAMMFALVACSGNENGSSGGNNSANSGGTSSGGGHEVELIDGATAPEDLTFGLTPFEDRQTLRIGFFTGSPLSYAFLFADNLGVFDALNIDVEYSCFTGGPAMMEANSEWDMASCGLGGVCTALAGYDFTLVDVTDYEENMAIFVRPDSELANDPTNPDLWKGATVVYPAGTTGQAVLAQYLETMGLTLSDVESVNMDNANGLTGFNGGTGDALMCWNAIALSAEDRGYVRVTDSGQLNLPFPCCTFAQTEIMESNPDLVAAAVAVFHLTYEWVTESEGNAAQAAAWYLEHCDEEGFLCDESIAERTINWWRCPTVDEYIALFTETEPDEAGLYTSRDLLQIENDILSGFDFFTSVGSYTEAQRTQFLDDQRVDNSIALAVKEMLGR